ncbi:MAG: ExbD/TolR family protein [Bacteroidales bacterium]
MPIKRRNKVDASFSMSSMTDVVFLLLIFFMVTSTLVAPNAIKLLLPQSNSQTAAKPITTVSITADIKYYVNKEGTPKRVMFEDLETAIQEAVKDEEEPCVSLHAEKSVPVEEVVKVMNIARRNKYKLILATSPEK